MAAHVQAPSFAPAGSLDAGVRASRGAHVLRAMLGYRYEPLTLHTFNLETTDASSVERLVVTTSAFALDLDYAVEPARWVAIDVALDADVTRSEIRSEHSAVGELALEARLGALRGQTGLFGLVGGDVRVDRYPNYRVADRRLDQNGGMFELGLGWAQARRVESRAVWQLDVSQYLDARYDRITPSGAIERATQSKRYLEHTLDVVTVVRPRAGTRLGATVNLTRNNSDHYSRAVTGVDASGAFDTRVYRDYFDFWRYGVELDGRFELGPRVELGLEFAVAMRRFDTQEARDANNVFLGTNRRDVESHGDLRLETLLVDTAYGELALVGQVVHELNRSNMKRERSFATNYDVTVARLLLAFTR